LCRRISNALIPLVLPAPGAPRLDADSPAATPTPAAVYAAAIDAAEQQQRGPVATLYVSALKSLHKRVRGCFTAELGLSVSRTDDDATLAEYGWRAAVSCVRLLAVQGPGVGVGHTGVQAVRALLEYARLTQTPDARHYQQSLWHAVNGMHQRP
jgi:hypothetical protein